jgi:hypothetical protein
VATTQQSCQELLESLTAGEQARLLKHVGFELTVLARSAYEFQGPGVADPRLLRDLNEIQHRIFGQLASFTQQRPDFTPEGMAAWLLGEGKPHLQGRLAKAFDTAVQRAQPVA